MPRRGYRCKEQEREDAGRHDRGLYRPSHALNTKEQVLRVAIGPIDRDFTGRRATSAEPALAENLTEPCAAPATQQGERPEPMNATEPNREITMGQATAIMSGAKQPDLDAYFEQAIPVLTFLGAIMFAGLVLNVSTPNFYNQVNSTAFVKFISPLPPSWYNGGVQSPNGALGRILRCRRFRECPYESVQKGI